MTSPDSPPPYKDEAPLYSSSLQFYGLALFKVEFDTPWSDRGSAPKPVVVELNSNQLNLHDFAADKATVNAVKSLFKFHNYDNAPEKEQALAADVSEDYFFDGDAYGDDYVGDSNRPMFLKLRHRLGRKKTQKRLSSQEVCHNKLLFEPTADANVYAEFASTHRGKLLHSYTLLHLSVGEAPSAMLAHHKEDTQLFANTYAMVKYRNTLRLRVEYTQMLLHFWSFHGMVHWHRNMSVGRDLSSSIDDRKLSVLKSIPRNYSVVNSALLEASAREALTFNPETRKMDHRNSVSSVEDCGSCFSECSMNSTGTRATSLTPACSECNEKTISDVYGSELLCLENYYTPIEKQYISNCIPVLNSFDKWMGQTLTISSYEKFMPKYEKARFNKDGQVFISQCTFTNLVRSYNKHLPSTAGGVRKCMDFYVDGAGLVALKETVL